MQACSDLAHVVLVLVRRVTVVHIVHIGLDEVVVVFCSRFVRDLLYQEMFSLQVLEPVLFE